MIDIFYQQVELSSLEGPRTSTPNICSLLLISRVVPTFLMQISTAVDRSQRLKMSHHNRRVLLYEGLCRARKNLDRARSYKSVQYQTEAAEELAMATVQCYNLLQIIEMDKIFRSKRNVAESIKVAWKHRQAVSDDAIWNLVGSPKDDFSFVAITTLLAHVELEKRNWTAATQMYSYALLANIRMHGFPHSSTFKLLHGLGRAFYGAGKLQDAKQTYHTAFKGYMLVQSRDKSDIKD